MQCAKCKFKVDQEMKFALMKNMCPKCGSNLFSSSEMKDIGLLANRINRAFSSEVSEQLSFDLSLFFIDELKNGIGQKYNVQLPVKEDNIPDEDISEFDELEDYKKQIRAEIENEFPEINDLPDTVSVKTRSESAKDKAERLKEIYKKSGLKNKQGAKVRRR